MLVLGYYNPWLAAKALDQPVKGVDAAAKAYTGLSAAIESAAKSSGTTFVGLDEAFSTNDTTPTKINGRTVPENAAKICTLTNICTAADIHLTDEGAATVARVLAEAAQRPASADRQGPLRQIGKGYFGSSATAPGPMTRTPSREVLGGRPLSPDAGGAGYRPSRLPP